MSSDVTLLGIDIGGTKTAIELRDEAAGGTVARHTYATPSTGQDALALLRAEAGRLVAGRRVSAIGVSFGGLVSAAGLHSMHVPGWESAGLVEALRNDFAAPIAIANDAEAGALGEDAVTEERWRVFVYVTISTGIGAAILVDGTPFRGAHGLSAEIGHMVVADTGLCSCGRTGHLEAQASGLAIARRASAELADRSPGAHNGGGVTGTMRTVARSAPHVLDDTTAGTSTITAKDVSTAARQGDPRAQRILHDAGAAAGQAIANLALLVDPEIVVVGGGVAQAGSHLWNPLLAKVREHALAPVLVRPALHGPSSAVAGAIELAKLALAED